MKRIFLFQINHNVGFVVASRLKEWVVAFRSATVVAVTLVRQQIEAKRLGTCLGVRILGARRVVQSSSPQLRGLRIFVHP